MSSKKDMVNHPEHYEGSTSLECIDTMLLIFGREGAYIGCLFNAYKYLWRYKNKGKPEEDLEKAEWYLNTAGAIYNNCVSIPPMPVQTEQQLRTILDKAKDNWYADNH